MCSICHCSPCLSGCPGAPEPPAAFGCRSCKEGIYPGDEYAIIGGVEYCEWCIEDMPYCELVPLLGGEWKPVQEGEKIKCDDCGEFLPFGTEYGVIDGRIICDECIDDIPHCDLVTRLGNDWNTAQEDDIYDGFDG